MYFFLCGNPLFEPAGPLWGGRGRGANPAQKMHVFFYTCVITAQYVLRPEVSTLPEESVLRCHKQTDGYHNSMTESAH